MANRSLVKIAGVAAAAALGVSSLLASSACTAPLETSEQPCPCQAGWYCCSWVYPTPVCAATIDFCPMNPAYDAVDTCSSGIDLGTMSVDTGNKLNPESLEAPATVHAVGVPLKSLTSGQPVAFDYAASSSLTTDGLLRAQGWLFAAAMPGQSFELAVAATNGSPLSVPLQVYGPVDLGDGGGCSESSVASDVSGSHWTAPVKGVFFVAPTPPLTPSATGAALATPSVATQDSVLTMTND